MLTILMVDDDTGCDRLLSKRTRSRDLGQGMGKLHFSEPTTS